MNRESVKWLLIGLAGLVLVMMTVGIGAWLIYSGVSEWNDSLASGSPVEKHLGTDIRSQKEAEYFEALEAEPWLDRYALTSAEGEWYGVLYSDEDFARLEAHLGERLSSLEDGWDIREYSNMCTGLGSIRYGENSDLLEATLERWRTSSPESHHAWLISGVFYRQLAWLWRGDGFANTVADEGFAKFREYVIRSRECLEQAYELNPMDAESSSNLLITARDMSLGRAATEEYMSRVTKVTPNHFDAWNNYWFGATPKWGGSWEEVEAISEQTEALKEEYPMLGVIKLRVLLEMQGTREGYEDIFRDEAVRQEIVELYEGLLKRWPDKALLHMNYAYCLYWYMNDYARAATQLDSVGDRYYRGSAWRTLPAYNRSRAWVYAKHSSDLEEEERHEYVSLAHELDPTSAFVAFKMGEYYRDIGDFEEAESYYSSSTELDPTYVNAYGELATLYMEQGRYEEAVAEVTRALQQELSPNQKMGLIGISVKAGAKLKASKSSED